MSPNGAHRLADLLRLMLSTTAPGEAMAARAALLRELETQGLNLHDIAARIEQPPEDRASTSQPVDEEPVPSGVAAAAPSHGDVPWETACRLADTVTDEMWPEIAGWLADQDNDWRMAGRKQLLRSHQRKFVLQMRLETRTLRPTLRQCAWLLCLVATVSDRLSRPESVAAAAQVAGGTAAPSGAASSGAAALPRAAPAPSRKRRKRSVARPRYSSQQVLDWIAAVAGRQRRASTPAGQAAQPPLFRGDAVRVLVGFATLQKSWIIETPKGPVNHDQTLAAARLADAVHVSLRSVRRVLRAAREAGFLVVTKQGGKGRGQATIYRLAIPDRRAWRVLSEKTPPPNTPPRRAYPLLPGAARNPESVWYPTSDVTTGDACAATRRAA
jgi:hypothetical protein